ncbi:MAG: hypothetical protein VX463_00725, partial [Pseudomonadota bacterium]|nr:hypothetical protein [Pseudomonadota bacterium]
MNAPIIPETLVNVFTTGVQIHPDIAVLNDGTYVVTWRSDGQDGSGQGVVAQRFSAQGERIGTEFIVNDLRAGDQGSPEVTALAGGGFVITYTSVFDSRAHVMAKIYDAAGEETGAEFEVSDPTSNNQIEPDVLALPGGGFSVVWRDEEDEDIRVRTFDAAGSAQGASEIVNTYDTPYYYDMRLPSIAAIQPDAGANSLALGGSVIVWTTYAQVAGDWHIFAQRYDDAGAKLGGEFQVDQGVSGSDFEPRVVGLAGGRFVVVWTDRSASDGNGYGVYARVFEGDGTAVTGEELVNVQTSSHQQQPDVIATADGGFFVTWIANTSAGSGDGSSYGIFGRRFDASGVATTGEIPVNQNVSGQQDVPKAMELADGSIAVVWSSETSGTSGDGSDRAVSMILLGDPESFVAASAAPELEAVSAVRAVSEADFDSGAVRLDAEGAVALSDADSTDFDGGRLIVSRLSATVSEDDFTPRDADAQDQLGIDVTGVVSVAGAVVSVDGVAVGSIVSDGADGAPLIVEFGAGATVARVEALIEALTYRNLSNDPRPETMFQIQVEDGDGAASNPVTVTVTIAPDADGPVGGSDERQVNNYIDSDQEVPAIDRLSDGGWVITWTSYDQDGQYQGVYARMYGPDGAPRGSEFQVNAQAGNSQVQPEVAGLTGGGFVVVWIDDSGNYLRMARYDAAGTRIVSDVIVPTENGSTQTQPTVTALSNGGWVVGWATNNATSGDGDSYAVVTQVYNAAGAAVGGETVINTQTVGNQSQPEIAALDNGRFVVVWTNHDAANGDGSGSSIAGRLVAANGVPEGASEFRFNQNALGTQDYPSVAGYADGSFVVAWASADIDDDNYGVSARRFDASGTPMGDE